MPPLPRAWGDKGSVRGGGLLVVGSQATHGRAASGAPVRFIESGPGGDDLPLSPPLPRMPNADEAEDAAPAEATTAEATAARSQARLVKVLNSAIHLEKKYVERFVVGPVAGALEEGLSSGAEGSDHASSAAAASEPSTAASYPLAFLPPRAAVSWGHLLAQHHEVQIAPGGASAWEAVRDRTLWPQANLALEALGDQPETKDWAAIYRV